jgi:hypothetical protein
MNPVVKGSEWTPGYRLTAGPMLSTPRAPTGGKRSPRPPSLRPVFHDFPFYSVNLLSNKKSNFLKFGTMRFSTRNGAIYQFTTAAAHLKKI